MTATATSTTVRPAHTYAADGTYTVTLTVTDAWGDAATTTRVVTIAEPVGNAAAGPGDRRAGVRGANVHVLERRHGRPER